MILSSDTRLVEVEDITIIGNIRNGSFIGLDKTGKKYVAKLQEGKCDEKLEKSDNIQNLKRALIDNDILVDEHYSFDEIKLSAAYLHVTNYCNYNCLGCYSKDYLRNNCCDLSLEEIKKIIDELVILGINQLLISGGEPFLRSDITDIIQYADLMGISKIDIGTNGTCIADNHLKHLRNKKVHVHVSIDHWNLDKTYIRPIGASKRAVDSIKYLKKNNINVSLLPTVHKKNYRYIGRYIRMAKKLGVPISFSVLLCDINDKTLSPFLIDNSEFTKIISSNAKYSFDNIETGLNDLVFKETCGAGKTSISIDAAGNVYPCHMLHLKEFFLGNILKEDLYTIIKRSIETDFVKTTVEMLYSQVSRHDL